MTKNEEGKKKQKTDSKLIRKHWKTQSTLRIRAVVYYILGFAVCAWSRKETQPFTLAVINVLASIARKDCGAEETRSA